MNKLMAATDLSKGQHDLLRRLALPWLKTGEWPLWAHIRHEFDLKDLDADVLLQSLPRIGLDAPYAAGYGYTTLMRPPVREDDRVRLTVAAVLVLPALRKELGDPFVRVLKLMIRLYRGKPLSHTEITRAYLDSSALAKRGFAPSFVRALPDLLDHEPGVRSGSGVTSPDGDWKREIDRSVLRFRDVETIEDYVARTCELVDAQAASTAGHPVSALPHPGVPALADTSRFTTPTDHSPRAEPPTPYLDAGLLTDLESAAARTTWKAHKLLALCRELNSNHAAGNPYACAALIRAVLDHVPPVFGHKDFKQVAAQHTFTVQRTDKAHAQKLAGFKDIADDALHRPISANVPVITMSDLPEPTRLNALLNELLTLLRKA